MWDVIGKMVSSGETWAIVGIIFAGFVAAKAGILKVKGDKIQISKDTSERERTIIMNQTEYAKWYIGAFEKEIPTYKEYDFYHGKYIIEVIYDEIVKWIVFNHIQDTKSYVKIKQNIVWDIVQTMTTEEIMRTEDFKKIVFRSVAELVKRLVEIREEYNREA